jgi:flavorubredoxin
MFDKNAGALVEQILAPDRRLKLAGDRLVGVFGSKDWSGSIIHETINRMRTIRIKQIARAFVKRS